MNICVIWFHIDKVSKKKRNINMYIYILYIHINLAFKGHSLRSPLHYFLL